MRSFKTLVEDGGLAQNTLLVKKKKPMSTATAEISFQSVKEVAEIGDDPTNQGTPEGLVKRGNKTVLKKFKELTELVAPEAKDDIKSLDSMSFLKKHGLSKTKVKERLSNEEVEQIEEGRPSQRHPLEGHEYHKKTDAELVYIAKDAHKAAEAMKSHNTTAENKYRDQANDSATVRYFRQKNGMPDWYKKKYGHMKEDIERVEEMDKSQTPPGRDGGYQFAPGPKVSKKDIEAVKKNPTKHLTDLFAKEYAKKKMKEEVMVEGGQDNAGGQYYDIKNSDGTIGMGYKPGKHYPSSSSKIEIKSEPKHPLHGKQVTNGKVTGRLIGTEHQGRAAKIKHSSGMIHHVDAKEIRKADMKEEAKDPKEYGYEGDMAMNQLQTIMRHAEYLMDMMKPDTDLPEWVQSKITLAADYIQTSCDYMTSEMKEEVKTPPFAGPYKKPVGTVKDKSGAVHTPMSRAKDLAKKAAMRQAGMKKESVHESRRADIIREAMKAAKEKVKKEKQTADEDKFVADPELNSKVIKTAAQM